MIPSSFWNNIYQQSPQVWGRSPNALVESLAKKLRPEELILDLGCGTGRDCIYLSSKGFQTVGVDLSNEAVRRAKQVSIEQKITTASFVCADYVSFLRNCLPKRFNAVLSVNALNHAVDHLSLVLRRIQVVLQPRGYLCLSLFASDDQEWIYHRQTAQRTYAGAFGQIRLYTDEEIQQHLSAFDILEFWNESYSDAPHLGAPYVHRNSFWRVIARLP